MGVKMNLRIIMQNDAADSDIGFLTKSISKPNGWATAMPTPWGLKTFLLHRSRNGLESPNGCKIDFVGNFISGTASFSFLSSNSFLHPFSNKNIGKKFLYPKIISFSKTRKIFMMNK